RLLQRALAVHHPRPGLVAELLDELRRDLSHRRAPRSRRWRFPRAARQEAALPQAAPQAPAPPQAERRPAPRLARRPRSRLRARFLGGQEVELALLLEAAKVVAALDPVRDRAPVREQAAEPAMVHVRHADTLGLLGDGVLALLLRADEQDRAAALGQVACEVVRLLDELERLLEVDDVDPAALGDDEPTHLRVPAAGLLGEMDFGVQVILQGG